MTERQGGNSLVARPGQPLIGIPFDEDGGAGVRYFADEGEADAVRSSRGIRRLIGTWSDMNWDETLEALERIRHENIPTPPITDL